jgi:hypothetical protein
VRFKRLVARGKAKPKVATAIARELTGFIWAIAQEVSPARATRGQDVFDHRSFRRYGDQVENPRGR